MMQTDNKWLKSYALLNSSFKEKMVFRLGADAGYFSEFNNMILAIVYCLKNRIKFELYSSSNYYSNNNSWTDFFIPFCDLNYSKSNEVINLRPYQIDNHFNYRFKKIYFKLINNIDYLTQDLWPEFHDKGNEFAKQIFNIPELGLKNLSLLQITQLIIDNIWTYNNKSEDIVDKIKNEITLPSNYISVHIRSGDKFLEKELFLMNEYMNVVAQIDCNDIFVLTDDYTIIENLINNYPKYNFFTLCKQSERGYFHKNFVQMSDDVKYQSHLRLFASIDLCAKSEKFIGTFSSNPGMYMGMRIGEEKCIGIDYNHWLVW